MGINAKADIVDAINRIQHIVGEVDGIRSAPQEPPETNRMFPFVITVPVSGTIFREGLEIQEEHALALEIHVSRIDLPRDVEEVLPYLRAVTSALWADPNLDGNVVNFSTINYTFGPLKWGDIETVGFRCVFDATQIVALTDPASITSGANAPTLLEAMEKIQSLMPSVVRSSPATPPETSAMFPFSVCYPGGGRVVKVFDWTKEIHTFLAEIHIARRDLPRDSAIAYQTLREFSDALFNDPTIGYNITTLNEIRYSYGTLDWGDVPTLGFRFEIDTKVVLG